MNTKFGRTVNSSIQDGVNMIKVFLAEDEYVVREGIKSKVPWGDNGYEFCGEAPDGELALPMIEKAKPDILITDIKMPFMDGLELARLVKAKYPNTEIVFLTGHAEFEYAKEAIKLGAAEYLSKPVNSAELLKALAPIKKRIEDREQEKEMLEFYRDEMKENTERDKSDLFAELVSGNGHTAELLNMAGELDMDLVASWYNILLLKVKSNYHEQVEFSKSVLKRFDEIEDMCAEGNPLAFDRSPEGKAYIFKGGSREELEQLVDSFAKNCKEKFDSHAHIRYFGGIGEPVMRLGELPQCYESAERAFAHRYLIEDNRIIRIGDVKSYKEEAGSSEVVVPIQLDRTGFSEFLKLGDAKEVKFFVEDFFAGLGSSTVKSLLMRQYVVVDAFLKVSDFVKDIGGSYEKLESVNEKKETLATENGAREYLCRIMEAAITERDSISRDKNGKKVSDIVKYIEDNYTNEELNLNMVAEHMNFSPNHLSAIFSQETGQTLIKYLTDLRLKKAKELLKCTSMRASEICEAVGYKDAHYFSYLFKKNVGMSPMEFREH